MDKALQFGSGGTSTTVTIPANNASWPLPSIQVGGVAGTIAVTVTKLQVSNGGQTLQLPSPQPSVNVTVPRLPPVIIPGSVHFINVTASGFTIELQGNSTPRDLTSAKIDFTGLQVPS